MKWLLLAALTACAHQAPIADDRPTYESCVRECALVCNGNDCRLTGMRPVGVLDNECLCAPWDA